ncbi:hypothetical protein L1857_26445 [Amycolatopsis thermalba]|uniref:Uncharacterized protein n=1 Tax=Amycolatopsis thermalba TaxID=944492 RepID=A0ABY4P187_9PSEU|nr:hypothetical protein L1857_26445 [Amycolatopsis thermalba]
MLAGSAVAVVAVLVLVLVVVLNGGDQPNAGTSQANVGGTTSTTSAPSSTSSSAAPADLGKTANTGSVNFGQAGQVVKGYLDGKGSAAAWALLTPSAQAVFGSQQAFQQYWSEHEIQGYNSILADKGLNSDGSADMYVTIAGVGRISWRVVNTDQGMRIDADTRIG